MTRRGRRPGMGLFRTRGSAFLRALVALGLLAGAAFGQIPGLSYKPTRLGEPVIIKKVPGGDICNLKELDWDYYSCEQSENYPGAAYLRLSCASLSRSESNMILLGGCEGATELKGGFVSLSGCNKFKCDIDSDTITLLVVSISGRQEHSAVLEHTGREYRLPESTRRVKLSPASVHVLYKKSHPILDMARKTTSWISPFYDRYVVYYVGSESMIPTIDVYFQNFESTYFKKMQEIRTARDLELDDNDAVATGETIFAISWIMSAVIEIYWSRGVVRPGRDDGFDPEASSFDAGLSFRSHCSLSFSSMLFNLKSHLDSLIHFHSQKNMETRPNNLRSLGVKEVFTSTVADLDSFYLVHSPNEVNSGNSGLTEEALLNKPFPCMSRYKSVRRLKKTAFDKYSDKNVDKEFRDFGQLSKTVNEDVLVLVNMIHFLIHKFVMSAQEKNPFLLNNSSVQKKNFRSYRKAFSLISKLRYEVEEVCGRSAFRAYLKRKSSKGEHEAGGGAGDEDEDDDGRSSSRRGSSSSSNKNKNNGGPEEEEEEGGRGGRRRRRRRRRRSSSSGGGGSWSWDRETHSEKTLPTCSLKYSLEVTRRLNSIFFSMFSDLDYLEQLRKIHLNSPEYLLRSTYCMSGALFGKGYRDLPNESIISSVMINSIISNYQYNNETSMTSECQKELREGGLSGFVTSRDDRDEICKSYSACMFRRESLNTGVDIFKQLTRVDHEGGFQEKSKLIREMCLHSTRILGLDSGDKTEPMNCQGFRLFQLALRAFQFQQEVAGFKFRISLADRTGNSYFISDVSTASYLLINDFCMDPEVSSIIQCSFDWEAYRDLGPERSGERASNSILLPDGSRISTPLYMKETTDQELITLSNGVLFARILKPEDRNLRLTYFTGLPFPYHGNREDVKRSTCEKHRSGFAYSPEGSNAQKILVLKVKFESGPISLITNDMFDNRFLIRNSRIYKDKFSVVDAPGLSVPLCPSAIQIERKASPGSPCNSLVFPYVMMQEFVNPLNLDEEDGDGASSQSRSPSAPPPQNTMDDVVYPMDWYSVGEKIERIDPLALNFVMTGRGREHLKLYLKAIYYIGYHALTALASFWTGGSRFRQHCDMHMANVLTRFPSSWKKLRWEEFITKVLENIDQRYFVIIDMDFSYESEMKITNLPEDIERLPDKDPCKHHSVTDMNTVVTINDYTRLYSYFCMQHMSLESLSSYVNEIYTSRDIYSDLTANYPDIMAIHNYTANYCAEINNIVTEMETNDHVDLAFGFKTVQQIRRVILNSVVQLDQLDHHRSPGQETASTPDAEEKQPKADLLSKLLLSKSALSAEMKQDEHIHHNHPPPPPPPLMQHHLRKNKVFSSQDHQTPVNQLNSTRITIPSVKPQPVPNLLDFMEEGGQHIAVETTSTSTSTSSSLLSGGGFKGKILPEMLSPIHEQVLSFYCTATSTRRLADVPSLRYVDLLNFLLQRSSLEGFIRQTHFGPSFEEFEPTRSKLLSVESARLECMRSPENKDLIRELMPLLYTTPEVICPRRLCKTVKHYDMFESMLSVYRFRLSHLVSMIYSLSDTYEGGEDQVLALRTWVVERDEQEPPGSAAKRRYLALKQEQVSSILEMYQFCARDRFYTSLSYGRLDCKQIPGFEENGEDSDGLLVLEFSMVDGSSSRILFPWVYNSHFSPFKSEFPFKDISGSISVIGLLRPLATPSNTWKTGKDSEEESETNRSGNHHEQREVGPLAGRNKTKPFFIHKGGKCVYDFNSRIDEYQVPPSMSQKVSEPHEHLYRDSFHGYGKMEVYSLSVFTIGQDKTSLYSWVKRIINDVRASSPGSKERSVLFDSIPRHSRLEIVTLVGLVVKVFKSIWIPNPRCEHYGKDKTVCFPMFCGMSSKNIILRVGANQKVKDVKLLFGQDIRVISAYSHRETPKTLPTTDSGSSELDDLAPVSHVLPNSCSGDNDEANDMITVASTLEYLTTTIQAGGSLDPLKLFSSSASETYYKYFKMTMEEIIGHVNKFCEELQSYSGSKNRIC